LRWGMIQAAAHARPSWRNLFHFYERIKTKKGSKVARVALARKMLTIAWYLIKKQEAFSLGNSGGAKR
jgi:transposase